MQEEIEVGKDILTKEHCINDFGDEIISIQLALMQCGYSLSRFGADGKFGQETLQAVEAFQKDHALASTGIVAQSECELLGLCWRGCVKPKSRSI